MKKYIYIFSAALAMAACNNEEINVPGINGDDVEVKFDSNLEKFNSFVVSRLSATSFDENDEVAIYASGTGELPFTGKKTFTADASGTLAADGVKYKSEEEISFTAIYPASLCGEDESSLPQSITLSLSGDEGNQSLPDLIYATATGSKANPTATFNFERKCAKISVAVKKNGSVNLEDAELYVKVITGGTFELASQTVTATGTDAVDLELPLNEVEAFGDTYGSTIVAPQTLQAGDCIGIKLAGTETAKYATLDEALTLAAGNQYMFNITASGSSTEPESVEISIAGSIEETPWSDGGTTVDDIEMNDTAATDNGAE